MYIMYGIYANIGGILMVNVTIYSIHGSYGIVGKYWLITKHQIRVSRDLLGADGKPLPIHAGAQTLEATGDFSKKHVFFLGIHQFWTNPDVYVLRSKSDGWEPCNQYDWWLDYHINHSQNIEYTK